MRTENSAKQIKQTSYTKVREVITSLNRCDLARVDFDYLVSQIDILLHGIPLTAHAIPSGTALYRGVIYNDKPTATNYLWHPPADRVTNYQRCNRPGKPMFYASVDISAIFAELNAQRGSKIYLSKWNVEKEFFYFRIPPVATEDNNSDLSFAKIETFFETRFAQPIWQAFSEQYKLTAAIAEKLTTGCVIDHEEFLKGRTLGGLVYPSVAHIGRSDNIAIQSAVARDCLKLVDVKEMCIVDKLGDSWSVRESDFSASFKNGEILWTGRTGKWFLGPGEVFTLAVENNQWVVRSADGRIVNPS